MLFFGILSCIHRGFSREKNPKKILDQLPECSVENSVEKVKMVLWWS